jgi:positive regulator of sigma E activity
MIEERAEVVACEGRFAWVQTQRASTCGSCAANKGCGTATLAKVLGQRRTRVRVLNDARAVAGEQVVIGLSEQALVRGALAVYLVPLLGLLGGALFGAHLAGTVAGTRAGPAQYFLWRTGLGNRYRLVAPSCPPHPRGCPLPTGNRAPPWRCPACKWHGQRAVEP